MIPKKKAGISKSDARRTRSAPLPESVLSLNLTDADAKETRKRVRSQSVTHHDVAMPITRSNEVSLVPPPSNNDETKPQEAPDEAGSSQESTIKLYKSSRLKSYITLALASFINYDAAQRSSDVVSGVPSTAGQRRYAVAVSVVSLILSGGAVLVHLDRMTPLEKMWITFFKPGSFLELALAGFLAFWWSIGTGVETSIQGMGGDSKGQYSFYFSCWACLLTSFGLLNAWLAAVDESAEIKAFIRSWPNRSPAWICIFVLSLFTLIWYLDLWRNHHKLTRPQESVIADYFEGVRDGIWMWLVALLVFTISSAVFFVLIEIFRETKADGISQTYSWERTIEGLCFFSLVLAWIPTVMVATTPGGPASLIGNAYFFTWLLVIFIFEGTVWYIHDMRQALHRALKEKEDEYRQRQKQIIEETKRIQAEARPSLVRSNSSTDSKMLTTVTEHSSSREFYDAVDSL